MLRGVVTDGTGTEAKVPGFAVAGKTGTAQVALPNGVGYAEGVYNSSFIGYLPAEDPEVVICVLLDAPTRGYYGGHVAAPTFASIGAFCMEHLRVAPRPPASKPVKRRAPKKALVGTRGATGRAKAGAGARSVEGTGINDGVTEADETDKTH